MVNSRVRIALSAREYLEFKTKKGYFIILQCGIVSSFLMFSLNCAVQGSPSGGPRDEIPPTIFETFPAPGDTLISPETTVSVIFSENMERESVLSALFISPATSIVPNYSWKGERLNIDFAELLMPDQTYVISVGSSAQDMHNNPAVSTYTFAFSTGLHLDRGTITGRVYKSGSDFALEGEPNALLWAYRLDGSSSPIPTSQKGTYITQSDIEGRFTLSNLADGKYRVFSFTNSDKDFTYFMRGDFTGFPAGEVFVDDSTSAFEVTFFPVAADTLPLQVSFLHSPVREHITITFDKPLDKKTLHSENFTIVELPGDRILENGVTDYLFSERTPRDVTLFSSILEPNKEYQVEIDGVSDIFGNTISNYSDSTTKFVGTVLESDAEFLLESVSPEDSALNVPVYEPLSLIFNKPTNLHSISNYTTITDSSGNSIAGVFSEETSSHFTFVPEDKLWQPDMKYFMALIADSITSTDEYVLNHSDTLYTFSTLGLTKTGLILGNVTVEGNYGGHPIVVSAQPMNNSRIQTVIQTLEEPGQYLFNGLLPGEYLVSAFVDRNRDERWFQGMLIPYKPSEPFTMYAEPVTVRQGIDNVGIDIKLNEY